MSKALYKILSFFGIYLLIFIISKPIFMLFHSAVMGDITITDWFNVIWHGIPMDCSMSGYLTVIPAILSVISIWSSSKIIKIIQQIYIATTAALISIVFVTDMVLYSYWNFRLDTTPFFYFFSSPASAFASTSILTVIAGFAIFILLALGLYYLITLTAGSIQISATKRWPTTVICVLATAALFIPIRGSVTVSTMNLSRSYYSPNQRLNHAAINPMFSLLYSATHQTDFSSQFRFFDESKCKEIFSDIAGNNFEKSDSVKTLLSNKRPDIYIIILESFSAHLMPSLGGEDIATGLDSIAQNGLLFTNFYASGARTDRALPAILSAFPAQPNTSLMKYAKKIENAPSLPRTLKEKAGYELTYYYGGDANFTNMLAYLISSGFDKVISDKDFPITDKTSKWGAHDHILFDRAYKDISTQLDDSAPKLRVIQTSSSHEPFEVPYSDARFSDNPRKNAFAYTDASLTDFINKLSKLPTWNNSIIIITPDHFGVYPENLEDPSSRHHIPLVITGGALSAEPQQIATFGDQTAIAATLLSALDIDHSDFIFSHDLFDPSSPKYAFFTEPGISGIKSDEGTYILNLDNNSILKSDGVAADSLGRINKAILQTVYTKLSEL